ncbi:hypothetical protein NK718_12020 [Alsobacter sp. SYSU M60028]|uniref:Lipoprotein n=1 Tax=Alsobacter ponti TaxID=2962936 RepID=A0ABT1LE95_9HYPH|nr:hypothetical protein [Alsobacter ponti]MCP8939246.1 hypothetical protein [Alsobacter ponti]
MSRTDRRLPLARRLALTALAAVALAGCTSAGESSSASSSGGFFSMFRGSSTPPVGPAVAGVSTKLDIDDIECPTVEVLDGGAAMRNQSAGGDVRSQLSLGETARECHLVGENIVIKIGVQGLALLGPAGSPGTFVAPVRFVAKRGEKVLVSRLQRTSVTIPAGQAQAQFVMVEDNIVVPAVGDDLTLIVGFDPHGSAAEPARKAKKRS